MSIFNTVSLPNNLCRHSIPRKFLFYMLISWVNRWTPPLHTTPPTPFPTPPRSNLPTHPPIHPSCSSPGGMLWDGSVCHHVCALEWSCFFFRFCCCLFVSRFWLVGFGSFWCWLTARLVAARSFYSLISHNTSPALTTMAGSPGVSGHRKFEMLLIV